ncbi:CubicO group peptidase (beta-lactamase class C family) [Elusimicrobium posterum]|uniref:serine hydrolase domain-containing protein n=1 Tax=Elusimicrobium posterum TaxID=3116653 RepID=UPI003C727327
MNKKIKIILPLCLFFSGLLFSCADKAAGQQEMAVKQQLWPTQQWARSTPLEEGVSEEILSGAYEKYGANGTILIVKNGKIIAENYPAPYSVGFLHHIYSCTKSVTSILGGIAVDKGYFSKDDLVLNFFPEYKFKNVDSRKKKITVAHLLSMSSGMDWKGGIGGKDLGDMLKTSDWTQFILDRPMLYEPGTHFNYNSGGTQLISTIIQREGGKKMEDFAVENLFTPLGIKNYKWDYKNSYKGITPGPWGLYLSASDMAKLGYLYLNMGKWEESQIVSEEWVRESVSPQVPRATDKDGYGYQWWMPNGLEPYTYTARGWYGKNHAFINVIPDLDIVVVIAGNINNKGNNDILKTYVIPAAQKASVK